VKVAHSDIFTFILAFVKGMTWGRIIFLLQRMSGTILAGNTRADTEYTA
jgi:hypothetical protein